MCYCVISGAFLMKPQHRNQVRMFVFHSLLSSHNVQFVSLLRFCVTRCGLSDVRFVSNQMLTISERVFCLTRRLTLDNSKLTIYAFQLRLVADPRGGGDGGYSPPLGRFSGKILRKNKKTKKGPFENEVHKIRGVFKNGYRLVSETYNVCILLLHVNDQA